MTRAPTRITRTMSGRMYIEGLTDADAIRSEYTRYTNLLDTQLAKPETDASPSGDFAVDIRFVNDEEDTPRTGWRPSTPGQSGRLKSRTQDIAL